MNTQYFLVVGDAASESRLSKLNTIHDNRTLSDVPEPRLLICKDEPKSLFGLRLADNAPRAVIDTKLLLFRPTVIDEALIWGLERFFKIPSSGVLITVQELRQFLQAHIGKFVICAGAQK